LNARKLAILAILPLLVLVGLKAQALEPNGTAIYSELGNQLYLGTLYLDTPSTSANEILGSTQRKRMELRFANSMSKRRWSQTWTQGIAINSSQENMINAAADLSETLSSFQSNLEYGDTVIFDYDPLYGTSVSANGVTLVKDKSAALFNLLLSAWIGPVPPTSQFKNAILGSEDSKNDYSAFLALSPSQERIDAVKSWSTKLKEAEERALAEAKAEEEAIRKAEEEAQKKAEAEALEEKQRLELIAEEKRKAQEAARKAAEAAEAERKEAERQALAAQQRQSGQSVQPQEDEGEDDLSAEGILAQQNYTSELIGLIYKAVKYPSTAVKRNQEGSVRASITIDRAGKVVNIDLVEQAPFEVLNKAVVAAINNAAPFPSLPNNIRGNTMNITVPVAFKLQ